MKKFLFYIFLTFTFLVISLVIFSYFNRDKIKENVLYSLNQHLKVEIKVKDITFSIWDNFPKASVLLHNLYIKNKNKTQPNLAKINKIAFSFDVLNILDKKIDINELIIENGIIHLFYNQNGENNFDILKNNYKNEKTSLLTTIDNVLISRIKFTYEDKKTNKFYPLYIKKMDFTLQNLIENNNPTQMTVKGIWQLEKNVQPRFLPIAKKIITSDAIITYSNKENNFFLSKANLKVGKYPVKLLGNISLEKDLVSKLSFFFEKPIPGELVHRMIGGGKSKYFSFITKEKGEIYGKGEIVGDIPNNKIHSLNLFNFNYKSRNAHLKGNLKYQSINQEKYMIHLDILSANPIFIKNIPDFQHLKRHITLNNGNFFGEITVQDNLSSTQHQKKTYPYSIISTLTLQNFDLNINFLDFPLNNLNAQLIFKNEKITFENTNLLYNKKIINGKAEISGIKKWYLEDLSPKISIQLDIPKLAREDILGKKEKHIPNNHNIKKRGKFLPAKDNLPFNINLNIKELVWKRYRFKNALLKLEFRPERINFSDLIFDYAQGKVTMEGYIKKSETNDDLMRFESALNCKNVSLPQLFYTSENFGQSFIQNKHLEGKLDIASKIVFNIDSNNNILDNTINSTLDFTINDGKLINFKPLQKLSKYLRKTNFSEINFGTLKDHITIKNNEIIIPKLLVVNTARTFEFSGNHGFNQAINYHLRVPIKKTEKLYNNATPIQSISGMSLYFNIIGTSDEYDIILEKRKIKEEIKQVFKKEKKEWQENKELGGKKSKTQLKINRKKKIE